MAAHERTSGDIAHAAAVHAETPSFRPSQAFDSAISEVGSRTSKPAAGLDYKHLASFAYRAKLNADGIACCPRNGLTTRKKTARQPKRGLERHTKGPKACPLGFRSLFSC